MATVQVNGFSLTGNGYGSFVEANNAHGTIKANGTASSNIVESVTTPSPVVNAFGSKVVEDTVTFKDYAGKAVSGGVFSHNHVKPISSLITDELAGVANDSIKTPGNDQDTIRSINKVENNTSILFTTAIRDNKYNRTTNEWEAGYPQPEIIELWDIDAQANNTNGDNAATPTATVPGELTYMSGAKTPYNDNYKAKTSY